MEKFLDNKALFSRLVIYRNFKKGLFIVKPYGVVNPSLVRKDLAEAKIFGESLNTNWTYLVDTEHVLFPNPLNLFLLKKIKELPNLGQYVIYAPSPIVRLLAKLTHFLIKPDRVITNKKDYNEFVSL